MNVWRDVILLLAVLGIFLFGFYLMTKVDKFLDENRKMMERGGDADEKGGNT